MSGNNSQPRQNQRDSESAYSDQKSTSQRTSDIQDLNSQKPKTSADHRSEPVSIGHYVLGKTIGQGTFGKVKVATHILTGEKVAIKILDKSKIAELADVERVAREIHILKIIRHPCVIQLYEIIETPRQLFLVMEFATGGELFDYIVAQTRVKEREACKFFQEIISGVEYIHKLNIVHRDLKPENLLLDHNKRIKIVDFGLSNTYKDGELLKTACGSPCYAAPEMIAGKKYKGLGADIWSCGVILFALVCGYLPFEDPNTSQLYKKIMAGDYTIPKLVSLEGKDLIKNILTTDPAKRYTIEDIRRHPWFNQVKSFREVHGIIVGLHKIPIDYDVLKQLALFKFSLEQSEKCLDANKHNHITTSYYLLLKKHLLSGGKSNADFNSDHFDPSLLTQPNPKRIKALRNNFTEDTENNKLVQKSSNVSKNSTQSQQSERPVDKDSNSGDLQSIEQLARGVTSTKNSRYVEHKRSGSTGESSAIEKEYSAISSHNQTLGFDKLRSRQDPRRPGNNAVRFNFPPQVREHSFDSTQQNNLPSVKNPAYEEQDNLRLGGFSNFQTPMSSQNERRKINPVFPGSIVRDIQTPSNDYFSKNQPQKNYPPLRYQPAINSRANKMLLGSVNKELFERKLNEVAIVNQEGNQRKPNMNQTELSNRSPKGYLKAGYDNETPKNLLNDSLFKDEMASNNNTIEHLNQTSYRSNNKNEFIGSARPILIQDFNNSKEVLEETVNISVLDGGDRGRAAHNTTLDNSFIINTLNTSMQRVVKPRSQSPKKNEPFIFLPRDLVTAKPTNMNNDTMLLTKYTPSKQNRGRAIQSNGKPSKPITAVGYREYRGRSIGGAVDERNTFITPFDSSSVNNSRNTSAIDYNQPDSKKKRVGNITILNNSILQDLSPGLKNNFFTQKPNLTMYFPDSKSKRHKNDHLGEIFNGKNLNLFSNSHKPVAN